MLRLLPTILALLTLTSTALADGRKPGSKLYYPVVRSGDGMFTIVSVTNTNRGPATPTLFGGSTLAHFEYYNVVRNPDNPFMPQDCVVFDRVEFLTAADTCSVLTSCHNATLAGGQEGYLEITAQDPMAFGTDWCHDFLIGSFITCAPSGVAYSANAIPRSRVPNAQNACDWEPLPTGGMFQFIASPNTYFGMLNISGQPTDIRNVAFEVWNDNEYPLSATVTFRCWFEQPLAAINPLFSQEFLRATPNDPMELDLNCDDTGDLETGWVRVRSAGLFAPGGLGAPVGDRGQGVYGWTFLDAPPLSAGLVVMNPIW